MTLGPESLPGAAVTDDRYLFRGLIRRGGDALGRDNDPGGGARDTNEPGHDALTDSLSRDALTDTLSHGTLGRDALGLDGDGLGLGRDGNGAGRAMGDDLLGHDALDGPVISPNGGAGTHDPLDQPSLADLATMSEPVYPPTAWLDATGTLANHPLLRGLLEELPPRGSTPPVGWLDRWFEAARSILELLYSQEHGR